jgi:hypothetical protein
VNRLHIMTRAQRAALEGVTDENAIYGIVRTEYPGTVGNGADELMSRKELEMFSRQAVLTAQNARFPVERARLALDIREGELRADVLDALAQLDVSNPRDCRDVFEIHQKVAGSIGEPTLREAIDLLAAADKDVSALRTRCDEIFPPTEED